MRERSTFTHIFVLHSKRAISPPLDCPPPLFRQPARRRRVLHSAASAGRHRGRPIRHERRNLGRPHRSHDPIPNLHHHARSPGRRWSRKNYRPAPGAHLPPRRRRKRMAGLIDLRRRLPRKLGRPSGCQPGRSARHHAILRSHRPRRRTPRRSRHALPGSHLARIGRRESPRKRAHRSIAPFTTKFPIP